MQEQIEILKRCDFCGDLPDTTLNELARIAVRQHYPAHHLIQFEGEPAEAMYIVAKGLVKISRIGSNGREQVMNVIGPGGHFNTVPIFDNGLCPANAETLSEVQLLILPRQAIRSLIERQPALALAMLGEFAGRLRHLVNLVDELALHSVQGRLAGLLLRQAEAAERGEPSPALTQAEIAARLGTVREMVARTLKAFEVQGAIKLDRGAITIIDRKLLAELHDD